MPRVSLYVMCHCITVDGYLLSLININDIISLLHHTIFFNYFKFPFHVILILWSTRANRSSRSEFRAVREKWYQKIVLQLHFGTVSVIHFAHAQSNTVVYIKAPVILQFNSNDFKKHNNWTLSVSTKDT